MIEQDSSHPTGVVQHGGSDTSAKRARERKAAAGVQLRLSGATWADIAQALGYPTPRAALVAVEKALEDSLVEDEDREAMRQLAGQRLNRLLRGLWSKAINPEDPEHLLAATKAREIIAQHSKLFGLDAPQEFVVHSPTNDQIEAWIAKVVQVGLPPVEEDDILEIEAFEEGEEDGEQDGLG